jgi:tetratricopeptide (TPR) repeat protein
MIASSENFETLFLRAGQMLQALPTGTVDPQDVATRWRKIVDFETDPVRRAEALINLATALDYTGKEGRIQAIAISDRALKIMGPKHYQAASAYLMAAQRLLDDSDSRSMEDLHRALAYLHAALAVPMTAQNRSVLVSILVRYATAARQLRDFSKLGKARHVFDRLRKYGMPEEEIFFAFGSMIQLYEARWTAETHRASLGKAITLSSEALALFKPEQRDNGVLELSALQQQHAILIMERYEHGGKPRDFHVAVALLREASQASRNRAAIFNSLAIVLKGSDAKHTTDADFQEARVAIDEGLALAEDEETSARLHWTEANWHLRAYWRGGPVAHLDSAVKAAEIAVSRHNAPDDRIFFTLSQTYYDRYRVGRDPDDIDRAIEAVERGLELCPEQGSERWRQEVTAANTYQERAINGRLGFDEDDAARAMALQRDALERVPRDSQVRTNILANALGSLIEHYSQTRDRRILDTAAVYARMLPDAPHRVASLPAIAVCNIAVFHLHFATQPTDRAAWVDLLRDVAAHNGGEESWLAASNLMHFQIGKDWAAVI